MPRKSRQSHQHRLWDGSQGTRNILRRGKTTDAWEDAQRFYSTLTLEHDFIIKRALGTPKIVISLRTSLKNKQSKEAAKNGGSPKYPDVEMGPEDAHRQPLEPQNNSKNSTRICSRNIWKRQKPDTRKNHKKIKKIHVRHTKTSACRGQKLANRSRHC